MIWSKKIFEKNKMDKKQYHRKEKNKLFAVKQYLIESMQCDMYRNKSDRVANFLHKNLNLKHIVFQLNPLNILKYSLTVKKRR